MAESVHEMYRKHQVFMWRERRRLAEQAQRERNVSKVSDELVHKAARAFWRANRVAVNLGDVEAAIKGAVEAVADDLRAEGLREAATAYRGYHGQLRVDVWLNVRADRIERGDDA